MPIAVRSTTTADDIGLSGEVVPLSGDQRRKPSKKAPPSAASPIADPFAVQDKEAGEHDQKKQENVKADSLLMVRNSTNKWWATGRSDRSSNPVVTNGAKLFHYLDSCDLALNVQHGQLKITTLEQAEQACCVRIYDVTPLVDFADRIEIGSDPVFFGHGGTFHDYQSLSNLIRTTVDPDTWESLGGPSTIAPFSTANRCWLVVSVPLAIHWKIEGLLNRLNE